MHKGVYRAYATAPHDVQATVKAVYSMSYILSGCTAHMQVASRSCILGGGAVQQLVCTWTAGAARGDTVLVLTFCLHEPFE